MISFFQRKKNSISIREDWKKQEKKYLQELQKFLDRTDNIENEAIRQDIVFQMLKCDDILTKLAEKNFQKYYEEGYKKGLEKNRV